VTLDDRNRPLANEVVVVLCWFTTNAREDVIRLTAIMDNSRYLDGTERCEDVILLRDG